MATSPRFKFPYLAASQSQKEVTVNQSLAELDAFIFATTPDYTTSAQPTTPANGDLYVVPAGATGTWAGKVGQVTWYSDGWRYATPFVGMRVIDIPTLTDYIYNGTAWVPYSSTGGSGLNGGALTGALEYAPMQNLASAATMNIGVVNSNLINVTGTVGVSSLGTKGAGAMRVLKFAGALALSHNANIILPGAASITTAAGDVALFLSEGAGVWRCISYQSVDGAPVFNPMIAARKQINNAAATLVATDRQVAIIAITATRIITLPAASAFPQGAELVIFDETGALTSAIKLTITAAGADLINGIASHSLDQAFAHIRLVSNGVSKWTITELGDNNTQWTFFAPTVTIGGGTLTTANAVCRYKKVGKTVNMSGSVFLTTITSGTGTVRITLPFPVQNTSAINWTGDGMIATKALMVFIATGTPTLLQMIAYDNTTIAVSGNRADFSITYETTA